MTNIDKLASQYIKNGGKYTEEQITAAMKNIKENVTQWYDSSASIFSLGSDFSGMSEEDFLKMMQTATSSSGNLDSDFSILYEIMNTDGNSGLSRDEIDSLFGTAGQNKISSFTIWHHLNVTDLSATSSSDSSGEEDSSVTDSTETTLGDSSGGSSSSNTTTVSKPDDFSDVKNWSAVADYIKAFLIDGNQNMDQPFEVIQSLYNKGTITEQEANFARNALVYGSQETDIQTKIRQYIEGGYTFDEAVAELGIDVSQSDLYKTAEELNESTDATAISGNVNIDACVEQLHDAMDRSGTDEAMLESILFDTNISANDFVEIVKRYEEKYGLNGKWSDGSSRGLVTRLEKETSGNLQSELTAQLANRLVTAASLGNEDAIDLLCKEIYSGTAGQQCTAGSFLSTVFATTTSDDIIAKINERYSAVNGGRNLLNDIKADYDGWTCLTDSYGAEGDAIIAKINQASRYNY